MIDLTKKLSTAVSLRQKHEQYDISKNQTVLSFQFSSTKCTHPYMVFMLPSSNSNERWNSCSGELQYPIPITFQCCIYIYY